MTTKSKSTIPTSSFDIGELIYVVFRHKWKIIFFAILGFAAAATFYFLSPKQFESQAMLLVRYVVERNSVDSPESQINPVAAQNTDKLINAELAILRSWDLAIQVAETVGPESLLDSTKGVPSKAAAAKHIISHLEITSGKGSNVIVASYQDKDPLVATRVLDQLITNYFDKHLEVHRSAGAHEFVTQQTDQVRTRLRTTEDELAKIKIESNISSLKESTATLDARIAKTQDELMTAEAEYAAQTARVRAFELGVAHSTIGKDVDTAEKKDALPPPSASPVHVQQYQAVVAGLARLRETELQMLSRYTLENQQVKLIQKQIADLEREQAALTKEFPDLAVVSAKGEPNGLPVPDLLSERARLAGMEATVKALQTQLAALEARAAKIAGVSRQVTDLERRRGVEEANYTLFASSLEKARIDEALDPSRMPNISIVQKPVSVGIDQEKAQKVAMGLAGGGLGIGLSLAFLIELVLRRTVKRPVEVESRLGIPLLATIPYLNGKSARLRQSNTAKHSEQSLANGNNAHTHAAPWNRGHFIRNDAVSIRDRLILSFEVMGLSHKPKLIAVTGLSGGEGVSTLAGGLAAAFSETGDGKVLLVDMNHGHPELHPFKEGQYACSLSDALAPAPETAVQPTADNLYLATAGSHTEGAAGFAPKRFYNLMPNFRASDFDYIIFDMPPLNQGSSTLAISRSMDKVLVVIEGAVNERQLLQRAVSDLMLAEANVEGIFNKNRSPIPKWLA